MASFFPRVFEGQGSFNWTILWVLAFVLCVEMICCIMYYTLYLHERISLETSRLSSQKEKLNQFMNTQPKNNEPHLVYGHSYDSHSVNTESVEYHQLYSDSTCYQIFKYKLYKCLYCKCCKKISNCITLRKYNNTYVSDSKSNINIIDEQYKCTLQRYNLWIWAHILRIIFLINALIDTFIQLTTQSVSQHGKYIIFNETLLFKGWSCRLNGLLRIIFVANSLMICSLFNWSKAASIFTSMLGNIHYGDKTSTKIIMKYGFIYICFVNPLLCFIGIYEFLTTKMSNIKLSIYDDYYCIITFDWYLFTLYLIHDIIVNVLLIILFFQPLYNALKRHKYVPSPYHFNCSPDNNPKHKMNNNNNNNDAMYDRLNSAIIRNAFAGIGTLIISTGYFIAYMYATYYYKYDKTHLWANGYILSGNITKYLLTFIFMTLTYRDWDYMFHPLCCYYCSQNIQKCQTKYFIICCFCSKRKRQSLNRNNIQYHRDSLMI